MLAAAPALAGGKSWSAPTCGIVGDIPSVSYTTTNGSDWATGAGTLPRGQGSFGIATADLANTMLTEYRGTIYRSTNAGCNWRAYAPVEISPLRFGESVGNVVYAWSLFAAPAVWRVDAKANPRNRLIRAWDLPADVLTVAADPANPDHVRALGSDGRLYESFDGGASKWGVIGTPAPVNPLTYFGAIDPANLDHAIIGMVTDGAFVTFDGGATWTQSAGLTATGGPRNAFNGVISAADGNVAWVMSLDLDEAGAGVPSGGRHIYRSEDGGATFVPVVDQGNGVVLTNGPTLAADPWNADVILFPWGSRSQIGGINLYRYDHATGAVETRFSPKFFEIRSFAFHPTDPSVVYAGFEGE